MAVDIENTLWAVYQRSTKTVLFRNKRWPIRDGGPIEDLDSDYAYLLQVNLERPDYDDTTQRLELTEKVNLRGKKLESGWTIVDLTQEEIDARLDPFFETSKGIKLGIDETDQNAFTRMMAMINLAGTSDSETVQIKDVADELHSLTVAELKTILKEYGEYCYGLFLS